MPDFELGDDMTSDVPSEAVGSLVTEVLQRLTKAGYDIVKENIVLELTFSDASCQTA